jgi:hypothetical protein
MCAFRTGSIFGKHPPTIIYDPLRKKLFALRVPLRNLSDFINGPCVAGERECTSYAHALPEPLSAIGQFEILTSFL